MTDEERLREAAASSWSDAALIQIGDQIQFGHIRAVLNRLDELRDDVARLQERGERCAACGRPTYVGEDFDGPCVEDSDVACALRQRDELREEVARLRGQSPLLDADPRPLTPEAFIVSCQRCRPTKHMHGWHARELGAMVEALLRERDEARADVERFRDGCERASLAGIAMRGEIDELRAEVERLRAALEVK